jgi:hypothetical protein
MTVQSGVVLEEGHLLVVPSASEEHLCLLADTYSFEYGPEQRCFALGVVSFCNHSAEPNAEMVIDYQADTYELLARQPIVRGSEVLIDYGVEYWNEHFATNPERL